MIKNRSQLPKAVSAWLRKNNPELLDKMFPLVHIRKSEENKNKILEFIKSNNRRPSYSSKDLEEKRLGSLVVSYVKRDDEFKYLVDKLCGPHPTRGVSNLESFMSFCNEFKIIYKNELKKKWPGLYERARLLGWTSYLAGDGYESRRIKNFKPVKNIDNGQFFKSINSAAAALGISNTSLSKCLKGKQKTAGGYHWAYCDDEGNMVVLSRN